MILRVVFLLALVAFAPLPVLAVDKKPALPKQVAKLLNKLKVPHSAASLYVHRLGQKHPRLSINATKPRNPASVMKIVTTYAGLDLLGPNYTWSTEAWTDGTWNQVTGELRGDLIIKGYGDPFFTPEKLWQFLYEIHGRGIRHIRGDIILDDSYFAPSGAERGDFDRKPHRAYNAQPNALSLNFQATQITVRPKGNKLEVFTYPPLDGLRVVDRVKMFSSPCKRRYRSPTLHLRRDGQGGKVELTGQYSKDCEPVSYTYLALGPLEQTGAAIEAIWEQVGGQLDGSVVQGELPESASRFHDIQSRTLNEIVRGINKYSSNLMARHLLLTLAAEYYDGPATADNGRRVIADWLKKQHLDDKRFFMENGAGLSRTARVTAKQLGQLLIKAWNSPRMPEFMASLPIIGTDGTMKRRLRRSRLKGRGHLKTGSLDNASSIAGYVMDKKGRRWVVVWMVNHSKIRWGGKDVQDAVLNWVYRGAP